MNTDIRSSAKVPCAHLVPFFNGDSDFFLHFASIRILHYIHVCVIYTENINEEIIHIKLRNLLRRKTFRKLTLNFGDLDEERYRSGRC